MSWTLATVWLGAAMVAVGLWSVDPLLLLLPGVALVWVGLTLDDEEGT